MTDVRATLPTFTSTIDHDERLLASFERLAREDYAPHSIIAETLASDWPGDAAGRLLLSLSRFARAGLPALEHAAELCELMLRELSDHGYFGPALGEVIDEQQLACHGWVVAGLLQYYYVTADRRVRAAALRTVDTLILPALERLDSYPTERTDFPGLGGASGTATAEIDGWRLSSDVWCVLLSLNALVPAYQETARTDIRAMIDRLAEMMAGTDFVSQKAQLHASLAAARCLSELAVSEADGRFTAIVSSIYEQYVQHGRSLNYAPFNWFDRPDSWSEPCAMVDSLGVAHNLAAATGLDRYRLDAQRIEFNALSFAERRDGSFGLDSLPTPDDPILRPIHDDARWCCTMRGAIGLLEAREASVGLDVDRVRLRGHHTGLIRVPSNAGEWVVREDARAAAQGSVTLEVLTAPGGADQLSIEVSDADGSPLVVQIPPVPGTVREIRVPSPAAVETLAGGSELHFAGPVLLVKRRSGEADDSSCQPLTDFAGAFPAGEWPTLLVAMPSSRR
jgi:hypothetical protein